MKIISKETSFLLALSQLKGIGRVAIKNIVENTNPSCLNIDYLAKQDKKIQKALNEDAKVWDECLAFSEKQIEYAKAHQSNIISILDDNYPTLLKSSKHDPAILFIKGNTRFNQAHNSVGIIGTREPTPHGKIITERISQFFIKNNWSIISGLAIGCDSIAHQTAVKHKAHTIAVLAHGLEMIAPKQNEKLAEDILNEGGALISQFPFKSEIRPTNFVMRDKIQAGLSKGIVMVQSDIKGGSLHASRAILMDNRWLAVPNPTKLDRDNQEAKIGANLVIIDGKNSDIESLLECNPDSISNIIKLYSKEDYSKLIISNDIEQFLLI